jgi:hypothetical protein
MTGWDQNKVREGETVARASLERHDSEELGKILDNVEYAKRYHIAKQGQASALASVIRDILRFRELQAERSKRGPK